LPVLIVGSVISSAIFGLFAREVAAPKLLGLPDHKCLYDLLPSVPEAVVAATLYATGGFSLGWAWVTTLLGRHPDTVAHLPRCVNGLLRFALWCYTVSVPMVAIELALA